jgi:hypothetical protein
MFSISGSSCVDPFPRGGEPGFMLLNLIIPTVVLLGSLSAAYFYRGWNPAGVALSAILAGAASIATQAATRSGVFETPVVGNSSASPEPKGPNVSAVAEQLQEYLLDPAANHGSIHQVIENQPAILEDESVARAIVQKSINPLNGAPDLLLAVLRLNPKVAALRFDCDEHGIIIRNGSLLHLSIASSGVRPHYLKAIIGAAPDAHELTSAIDEKKRTIAHVAAQVDPSRLLEVIALRPQNAHERDCDGLTPLQSLMTRTPFSKASVEWIRWNIKPLLEQYPEVAIDPMPGGKLPADWLQSQCDENGIPVDSGSASELLILVRAAADRAHKSQPKDLETPIPADDRRSSAIDAHFGPLMTGTAQDLAVLGMLPRPLARPLGPEAESRGKKRL